jgi:hypothetical protein
MVTDESDVRELSHFFFMLERRGNLHTIDCLLSQIHDHDIGGFGS